MITILSRCKMSQVDMSKQILPNSTTRNMWITEETMHVNVNNIVNTLTVGNWSITKFVRRGPTLSGVGGLLKTPPIA